MLGTEHYDQFFAPLVGNEERTVEFEQDLSDAVRTAPRDPYDALQFRLMATVIEAARGIKGADNWALSKLDVNARTPAEYSVPIARTIGDIYEERAKRTQTAERVSKSLRVSYAFFHGMAFWVVIPH